MKFVLSPLAFTLGALGVQAPKSNLRLSGLYQEVGRVFHSNRNLQTAFELDLQAHGQQPGARIMVVGSMQTPTQCYLRLLDGPPISASYFSGMADSFILGVLARHFCPTVQLVEVRLQVERFWRYIVVREQFYQHIGELVEDGLVISTDTEPKVLMLREDVILLEELLNLR